jgi:hypothetical protein
MIDSKRNFTFMIGTVGHCGQDNQDCSSELDLSRFYDDIFIIMNSNHRDSGVDRRGGW